MKRGTGLILVNATVSGDVLTGTNGTSWAAGTSSAQVLPAGADGWMEPLSPVQWKYQCHIVE
jgi:hypothetical protein